MQLTVDQQNAIDRGEIVEIATNGTKCALMRWDVFESTKQHPSHHNDMTHDEMMQMLAHSVDANGWNEPGMEDYDNYNELKNEKK